ncbi:hypothetical protein TWF751_002210 [Orbilia oligospora]|nr:hypothetical protein TWF751_002210 [Orbilia oligospora]
MARRKEENGERTGEERGQGMVGWLNNINDECLDEGELSGIECKKNGEVVEVVEILVVRRVFERKRRLILILKDLGSWLMHSTIAWSRFYPASHPFISNTTIRLWLNEGVQQQDVRGPTTPKEGWKGALLVFWVASFRNSMDPKYFLILGSGGRMGLVYKTSP